MRDDEIKKWISPYLDSEIDKDTCFKINKALDGNPILQRYFDCEEAFEKKVKNCLTSSGDLSKSWNRALQKSLPQSIVKPISISFGTLVAASLILFVLISPLQPTDLQAAVKFNHQLYVNNLLPMQAIETLEDCENILNNRLPFRFDIINENIFGDAQVVGYRLCHVKLCPVAYFTLNVDSKPVSVFFFDDKNAQKFTESKKLFADGIGSSFSYNKKGNAFAAYKIENGLVCAIGDISEEKLQQLVHQAGDSLKIFSSSSLE